MAAINFQETLSLNEVRRAIALIGQEVTIVVQSEPGCGKSSILKMLEEDLGDGYDYIYVDCPLKDVPDIGMALPNHESKSLDYYVASLFKMDSPKPKVIMLDEWLKAPKMLQTLFTRLALEKYVGDRPLPQIEKSIVFATSNNETDGVGDSILAHAANRVTRVRMTKPNANVWCPWASDNGVSAVMRAWVSSDPRVLASYTDGDKDNPFIFYPNSNEKSFCSPRSLFKADSVVRKRSQMPQSMVLSLLSGTIGVAAARQLAVFMDVESSLIPLSEVLKNPDTVKVPEEVAAQLIMMFRAVDELATQDELSAFMRFVKRIGSSELQAVFFTMMMRSAKGIKLARYNTDIQSWVKDNHELF